jgi:hypothetical protein
MPPPVPADALVLRHAESALKRAVADVDESYRHRACLDVLEAVAAKATGVKLADYRRTDEFDRRLSAQAAASRAGKVARELASTPMPAALALATLARSPVNGIEQRRRGAYYTDWRLAQYLASSTHDRLARAARVVDAASGSGILLAAVALEHFGPGLERDAFVADGAHAADVSPLELRATKLTMSALTSDLDAVRELNSHLRVADSLASGPALWHDRAPNGFDLVIGNPPWEKLRLTRHEHLKGLGVERHYGADYEAHFELAAFASARERMSAYVEETRRLYEVAGGGEIDLYRVFLALALNLARDGGEVAYLVPAGLIRSQGTAELRRHLLSTCGHVELCVLENRAKFFAIDTRFKFLCVHAVRGTFGSLGTIILRHGVGSPTGVMSDQGVAIPRTSLAGLRPDLSVPEVRTDDEWALYLKMSRGGKLATDQDDPWFLRPVREVDMTLGKSHFVRDGGGVPVVEGRMIQQFRCGAKRYESGSGRRARWGHLPTGADEIAPQFWIPLEALPDAVSSRVGKPRLGFCDIVGQTNERTMMAGRIPSGCVCGNKVPTICFEDDRDGSRSTLWLGIANSLAFDWLLRRVVTTTVNFFVLRSIPLPDLHPREGAGRVLVERVRRLENLYAAGASGWDVARLRAEIDARVLAAYGVDGEREVRLLMNDFPLLDRRQPPLRSERRSTITRDFVRLAVAELACRPADRLRERCESAWTAGAKPFIPSEFAMVEKASDARFVRERAAA